MFGLKMEARCVLTNEDYEQVMKEIYQKFWPDEDDWDGDSFMEETFQEGLKEWESGDDEADEWWNQEESF